MSGRISTNTGTPPRRTNAVAVVTNVNEGMTTSSPGSIPASIAAISRAPVHEWVRRALRQPVLRSSHSWQRAVNGPLPEMWPPAIAFPT